MWSLFVKFLAAMSTGNGRMKIDEHVANILERLLPPSCKV